VKLPRKLYGHDLARVLCARWAYRQVNQVAAAKGVAREDLLATLS